MNKIKQKLSFFEKVGYGFGDLASNLFWQTISMYLLFFYTDVFKLPAAAVGTMILISRLLDGINDPAMGIIADRTNTKWGKFRPYLLWLAVPMGLIGVIAFTTPNFSPTGKIVYAYITFNLLMITYTAINIPYSSLMGVMSSDGVERTSLSSFKFVFAYTGGLIVSMFALPLTDFFGKGNETKGWQLTMTVFGIAAVIFFLITFFSTKERIHPPKSQQTSIISDLSDLFKNKPWIILLFTGILMIVFVATRLSATPYYFKYYVGNSTFNLFGRELGGDFKWLTSAYNTTSQLLSLTGTVFAFWFAKRFGKRYSFIMLFIVAVVATGLVVLLKPQNIILLFLLQILGSISGGPLTPLIWAMYADTADYSEYRTGRRATGLVFSASTMSQKIGWAVGMAFASWILGAVGYAPDSVPSPEVQNSIKYLISLLPAGAGVLAIILMLFYQLHDKKMEGIQIELADRRKEEEETN